MCRYGKQDSIGLARALDDTFRTRHSRRRSRSGYPAVPAAAAKVTPGTAGLSRTPKGWTIFFGGNGGTRPRFGDLIARDLASDEVIDCALRLAKYYCSHAGPHERTARFMERTGIESLRSGLLTLLPYIPVKKGE